MSDPLIRVIGYNKFINQFVELCRNRIQMQDRDLG